MSLALHQLRHEFRRSRVFIAVFWIILFGNYSVAVGWIGEPEYNPLYQGWGPGNMIPGLLSFAFWIALTLLVMTTIVTDSPSNRERFLATRPLPGRALRTAKALFILVALLVPATIVELLSLRSIGIPVKFIMLGTMEYFSLLAIFCAALALFSAHWKSTFTALLALGLVFGLASAFIGTLASLVEFLTRDNPGGRYRLPEPNALTVVLATVVACLGFAASLRLHTSRQWKARHLILPFSALTLVWFAIAIYLPMRPVTLSGTNEALVQKTLGDSPDAITILPSGIDYGRSDRQTSAAFEVSLATHDHPDDWEIRWWPEGSSWTRNGRVIHQTPAYHRLEGTVITDHQAPASPALLAALRNHAPGVRLLIPNNMYRDRLRIGQISYPPNATPTDPISVSTNLTATALRWNLAARLRPFAKDQGNEGKWKLQGIHQRRGELTAFLSMRTHRLLTIDDPSKLTGPHGWTSNVLFALHVPARDLVWIGDSHYARRNTSLSSAVHAFGEVRFENHHAPLELSPDDLRSARLLVLEARHLGQVSRDFQSPEFQLQPQTNAADAVLAAADRPHQPETNPAALARWLREHEHLPADLPADELRIHLDALFNLECRANAYVEYPRSPTVNHLARFVPHHRDLFLESIRGISRYTPPSRLILFALTQAATEDDKAAIIAELPRTPILITVLNDRGWIADAQPQIIEVLRAQPENRNILQALVSLNHPALDPLLLDSFERIPVASSYKMLRSIPRLREPLDDIASRQWSPDLLVMNNLIDWKLELALLQGRPEALAHLYGMLPYLTNHHSSAWQAGRLVTDTMILPRELEAHRHDEEKVFEWLRNHEPADFRFDPVLQRFALTDPNPS